MRNLRDSILTHLDDFGRATEDNDALRLEKTLLVSGSVLVVIAASIWGLLFLAFGETPAGWVSFGYALTTLIGLATLRRKRNHRPLLILQLLLGMLAPFLQTLMLGGFALSASVIIWSLLAPIGALVSFPFRTARLWWLAYLGTIGLAAALHPLLRESNRLPPNLIVIFFALNIGFVSSIVFVLLRYFIRGKDRAIQQLSLEEERSEALLHNILPQEIAEQLKRQPGVIAESFSDASILFADLVQFTRLTADLEPEVMVKMLNEVFSHFDALVERYDVEKIRIIGDNYMVAAGVPRPCSDHAERLARLALDMRRYLAQRNKDAQVKFQFRIGINSGPVIGGVIGTKKFVYDVWGDAVNLASRMESHGLPGKIQVTQTCYARLKERFVFSERGLIKIKGRGELQTWFLEDEREGGTYV